MSLLIFVLSYLSDMVSSKMVGGEEKGKQKEGEDNKRKQKRGRK